MVSSLIYLLWKGKDEEDQNKRIDGFYRIVMELPPDFASMAMMAALVGDNKDMKEKYTKALFYHPKNKEWVNKFGKSLKKRLF
jgi:Tfp pilus assembly protein PilF